MSTNTFTVTTSWQQIFNIPLTGYFSIHMKELASNQCQGSVIFLENGNLTDGIESSIMDTRGINLISYLVRNLPMTFTFDGQTDRTYEIQKNVNNYLEVRLTSGTDIQVSFTLFSGFPDKSLVFVPKLDSTNKTTSKRLGTFKIPQIANASLQCISWMDNDVTDYTINIIDVTNNTSLLSVTLNNTSESIQTLGNLSNLAAVTQIDITLKKNGGNASSKAYLESLTINYN